MQVTYPTQKTMEPKELTLAKTDTEGISGPHVNASVREN